MALSGVRASPKDRKAVRDRTAPSSRTSEPPIPLPPTNRMDIGTDDVGENVPTTQAGAESAGDASFTQFGIRPHGGPARFERPGWFYVGTTLAHCPDCGSLLEGLRAPYRTRAGVRCHFWALVCLRCARLWAPRDLTDEVRHDIYESAKHRPTSDL